MSSFKVYYVDADQKIREWEEIQYGHLSHFDPPLNLSFFELQKHNIPQKNTILIKN